MAVVLLVVLVGAGCGASHARQPASTRSQGEFKWKTFSIGDVTQVRSEKGGRVLTLDFEVPSGRDCYRNVQARTEQFEKTFVRVDIRFEALENDMGKTDAKRCRPIGVPPKTLATAKVSLPGPFGKRSIVIGQSSEQQFTAASSADGPLRRCGQDGCHPAPTGCTEASYQQTIRNADIPRHTYTQEHCSGHWLVIDFSMPMGPACGDASPGTCDRHAVGRRTFYRYSKTGWVAITSTTEAGCQAVLRVEPRFPRKLCAKLKALN
ncbi:hypothetical protein [Actinomadura decatromicini]|uniref:Uncharacterized protein n=1 Tax=Actinomadura decatromicini TaxID=2604572 RepID=A0A5D3FNF1_9ACTN|nr:hypothetical protein [Actinomadura decatromicini]TYK49456.1 hypothetical protein FXF68_17040 [Actinomadura decatromicini]